MDMISYENERLGFFADQRKLVQKRYDRLEKQIKPDEPYTSERREFLSDLGRELSFYNDVIEMLENDVVSEIFKEIDRFTYRYLNDVDYAGGDLIYDIAELKNKYITK